MKDLEAATMEYVDEELQDVANVFHQKCVYFMRAYDAEDNPTNAFKIGYTDNLAKRFEELRFGYPFELKLFHVVYTQEANMLERIYHKQFKDVRLHHEWFQLPDNVIEKINHEYKGT